jgi:hypothetical protein
MQFYEWKLVCVWCCKAPRQWKIKEEEVTANKKKEWTIERLKATKLLVEDGTYRAPSEIHGVPQSPVWGFIEVDHIIYPVLHGEIGLVNDVLDSFYDFLDDNIEVMTNDKKSACNQVVLADVALETSLERINDWKNNEGIVISFYEVFKADAAEALKNRKISREEKNQLQHDKKEI